MKVLHLLTAGGVGGIEVLMKNYAQYSMHENIFTFFWGGGVMADEIRQAGGMTIEYNMRDENAGLLLWKILVLCRKETIDVVISHHSAPFLKIVLGMVKIMYPKIQCIAYAHANARDICEENRKKGRNLRKFVQKAGFQSADRVIAISESVKQSLVEYLQVDSAKIEVVYNGIPVVQYFSDKKKDTDIKRLIYVGRLTKEKGVQHTIEILHNLKDRYKFEFWIVGDGEYRETLEQMVKEFDLSKQVQFLGIRKDVAHLLAQADYFIHLPEWEEGFGITIIEAMAAGLICICGKKGAIPEIITNAKDGFIVDMDTLDRTEYLAEKIFSENIQEEFYEKIRKQAKERAEYFSIERFSKRLDKLIEER